MAAVGVVQYLIGGTRLLFSLPGYELLAVGSFLTLFSIRQVKSSPRLNCLLATALLFTYLLVRCVYSPIDYLARPDYFTILGCLMVYFLTCFYLTQSRPRIYFIFFLLALALVHVWVGAIQFTDPEQTYMLQGFLKRGPDSRACGLLIGPNVYAGYLEAVGVMGFSLVWWSRLKFWLKLILFYVSACCYVGIALSGSRGGYFSSTASILMLIALSLYAIRVVDRQKFARLAVVSALLFAMTLGGAVFLMGHSALIQSRMSKMVAHDMRIYMWQASLDDFKTSPTIGTGSGTYLYFGRLFRRAEVQNNDPIHSHCDYLELLAEYGVCGALCMLVFLWFHLRNGVAAYSWLLRRRLLHSSIPRSDAVALNIGALSALTALAVHSLVDFNLHIPGNALMFAFVFGLIANPGAENPDLPVATRISGLFRFALPLLAIWVVIAGLPKLPSEYFAEESRVALRDRKYAESIELANIALGQVAPDCGWPQSAVRMLGGEKSNPDLYFYIGESNRQLGVGEKDPELRRNYLTQSVEAFSKANRLFPQDQRILLRMGQSLDALKRFDDAELAYQRALAADPNLGVLYGFYGTHLKVAGKLDESSAAYEKGLKLTGQSLEGIGEAELGF